MYRLTRQFGFRELHRGQCYESCPEQIHYHDFVVEVTFEDENLGARGCLITELELDSFAELLKTAGELPDVFSVESLAYALYCECEKFYRTVVSVSLFATDMPYRRGEYVRSRKSNLLDRKDMQDILQLPDLTSVN